MQIADAHPAFLVVVGAHYLPFTFLYGMWIYTVLAGLMVASGVMVGTHHPHDFQLGGWAGAILLLAFALPAWAFARAQDRGVPRAS